MLLCCCRATRTSSSRTLRRLVAACIVSFVLVSSCSWCAAQEVIDIAPEDVSRYYPDISVQEARVKENIYVLERPKEPVTVLLRTDPESEFEMRVALLVQSCGRIGGDVVLTNGWNPGCQLRFECQTKGEHYRTWAFYEKSGSQLSRLLKENDDAQSLFVTKQADGAKIGVELKNFEPVPIKDCILEAKRLGDHLVYNLTFAGDTFFAWNPKTTVFVRQPTATPEATDLVETDAPSSSSPDTTKRTWKVTSKPAVDTQAPPSHSASPNENVTMPSEPSAAGGLPLGPFVAAVVVTQ
ncbi:hypothetical protein AAVH_08355 [Aphelenchoides avenae]|nr:hypothetical protein AAVH_08355 [Aphelenchus avenae]